MSDKSFCDLPLLAEHLRSKLEMNNSILIYAYNGTGKTRLSTAFKNLGKSKKHDGDNRRGDTLYFNAYTEDLFHWDNDIEND